MQWTFEPPIVAYSFGLEVVDVRVLAELAQRELVDVEFCDFLAPEGRVFKIRLKSDAFFP